jgi:GntP family gluconate:H+ symporter
MLLLPVLALVSVAFIVVSTVRWRWHPVPALLLASLMVGLGSGLPGTELLGVITQGFGALMGSIGLVVILGSILGIMLEASGSMTAVGQWMLGLSRGRYPIATLSVLGFVLGIPVFCDSGFIVLSGLTRSLALQSSASFPSLSVSLASGLMTTHVMVPPTPGPLAAAGNLGLGESLGLVILIGLSAAILPATAGFWFARRACRNLPFDKSVVGATASEHAQPVRKAAVPLVLIFLPVLLIATGSLTHLVALNASGTAVARFAGHPVIALLVSVLLGALLLRLDRNSFSEYSRRGVEQAGPILLITGCGGAFGAVLKATPLSEGLEVYLTRSSATGAGFLLLAFLVAAVLKSAQGSSTSSIIITSALLAPFAAAAGFSSPISLAILVAAVGAGSLCVSHANDSYFWVVARLSGFDVSAGYRSVTLMSLVLGLSGLVSSLVLYWLLA